MAGNIRERPIFWTCAIMPTIRCVIMLVSWTVAFPQKLDHLKISRYTVHGYQFKDVMISSNICGRYEASLLDTYVMRAESENRISTCQLCVS